MIPSLPTGTPDMTNVLAHHDDPVAADWHARMATRHDPWRRLPVDAWETTRTRVTAYCGHGTEGLAALLTWCDALAVIPVVTETSRQITIEARTSWGGVPVTVRAIMWDVHDGAEGKASAAHDIQYCLAERRQPYRLEVYFTV